MKQWYVGLLVLCFISTSHPRTPDSLMTADLQEYKPIFPPIPEQTVYPNQELVVKLNGYNHKGSALSYSHIWSRGGRITEESNEFRWVPSEKDIGSHAIIFTATEPYTHQSVSQPVIITVKPIQYTPSIHIESNRPNPTGFWEVPEGGEVAIVVQGADRNSDDELTIDYFVNHDPSRKLSNAQFQVNGNVATFLWTPNDRQAKQKSMHLTFRVSDNTGLHIDETIPLLLRDVPHVPEWQNRTREFFIDEGELLTFTVTARDADDEPLQYKVVSSDIKQNDYYFDADRGRFQWKPTFEYTRQRTAFMTVFSVSDGQHTVLDTIIIRVDPKNYPPEMETIREREVKEGEELVLPLVVKDKNGDENLDVRVVEADMSGYQFDEPSRTFRWRPDFSFVKDAPRRTAYVKFRVFDGEFEAVQTARISIIDRDNPAEILQSYQKTLASARSVRNEVTFLERRVGQILSRKKRWDLAFDVSTIAVGAFVGIASSSLASEKMQNSAVPIGAAATTLIGVRSVISRGAEKYSELRTQLLTLQGNVDFAVNAMLRRYGESPDPTTIDTRAFKSDFQDFLDKIEHYETQKEKMKTRYAAL